MQVQKRNGKVVDFDVEKIKKVILRAYNDVYDFENNDNMTKNLKTIKKHEAEKAGILVMKALVSPKNYKDIYTSEEVWKMATFVLMDINKEVALTFITYRYRGEI